MKKKNKKGFTFIEAILTMSLMAAGFVGVFTLYQQNIARSDEMEQTAVCVSMAQEMLERITQDKAFQEYDYVDIDNYTSPESLTNYGYPGYTRTISIQEVSAADLTTSQSGSGYKRVEVAVEEPGGTTITLTTLLTQWQDEEEE